MTPSAYEKLAYEKLAERILKYTSRDCPGFTDDERQAISAIIREELGPLVEAAAGKQGPAAFHEVCEHTGKEQYPIIRLDDNWFICRECLRTALDKWRAK